MTAKISSEIDHVNEQIQESEKKIALLESQMPSEANRLQLERLWTRDQQLRKEKEQLRKEEEQLREKELIVLKSNVSTLQSGGVVTARQRYRLS